MINNYTCAIRIMESKNIDAMNSVERSMKRTCDVIVALVLLVVLSPVFIYIYVVQKITSEGPAIYSQERIGQGGRPFMIYKFRTMVVEAEKDGCPVLEQTDDPRLTPFGKMLRRRHLDELPQIWNVLRGDMSFVGYRPERRYFIEQIMQRNPDYALLFHTQPGVTSLATIKNGYTDTMEKMLKRLDMDLDYLRHRSLWLDVKIVIMTVLNI